MTKLIGCAGAATAGKDTFCRLLINKLSPQFDIRRYGLADILKNELKSFLLQNCNIDIWNCSKEEKELIRPLMVEWGRLRRVRSKGTYWWKLIDEKIEKEQPEIAIISDVRYCFYDNDEDWWLQQKRNGQLVFIKRLNGHDLIKDANIDEKTNNTVLEQKANYKIEWKTDLSFLSLNKHIEDFVSYLRKCSFLPS